jgi:hypothetical protein
VTTTLGRLTGTSTPTNRGAATALWERSLIGSNGARSSHGNLVLEAVLDEQSVCWNRGERPSAEELLERFPAHRDDPQAAVDVIYQEFLLRHGLGERPRAEEYIRRFLALSNLLIHQFAVDEVLRSAEATTDVTRDGESGHARQDARPKSKAAGGWRPAKAKFALDLPVSFVAGSGPHQASAVESLYRNRMRAGILIILVGFGGFLVKNLLWDEHYADPARRPVLWAHIAIVAAAALVAPFPWGRLPLSVRGFRAIELVLMVLMTIFPGVGPSSLRRQDVPPRAACAPGTAGACAGRGRRGDPSRSRSRDLPMSRKRPRRSVRRCHESG